MGTSYRAQVATAFEVLSEGVAPFVDARMAACYPDDDWVLMAATKLGKRRDVLVSLTDPHFQLEVLNRWWGPAFSGVVGTDVRQVITDLRTARNHWAHPDEDHPFDIEYAARVHGTAEELLRAIDSQLADQMAALAENLRWDGVRDRAQEDGMSESDAMMQQMAELQERYEELQGRLETEREVARSAAGRTRAFARQLAELQTQYAAVAGLRDEYQHLREKLDQVGEVRPAGGAADDPGGISDDTLQVRTKLVDAERSLAGLQGEASLLRDQLAQARRSIASIDPVDTDIGRRWIWLVTVLILLLGVLVVVATYLPR